MQKWVGSSGVCINENGELLMVLQGKPEENKTWSVPSGGQEKKETFEECCIREIKEETGYSAEIVDKIKVKKGSDEELTIEVHYFLVKIVGGEKKILDPGNLIYDIDWKSIDEIKELSLTFPGDRAFLMDCIKKNYSNNAC